MKKCTVWVEVPRVISISSIFFIHFTILKDNQNEEEIDELADGLLELNREVYSLKKKFKN